MAKTPEGIVQTYAQEQLKKRGCLVRKIAYEGRRGCPDLLVLVPTHIYQYDLDGWPVFQDASTIFLEIKKDEQTEAAAHQERERMRMLKRGADVRVIGSKAQVDELVKELWPCD